MTTPREIAGRCGAISFRKPDSKGDLWHVKHPSGLACWVYLPRVVPGIHCYVISWYVAGDCKHRLSMSFSNVVRGAQRRANWRCFGEASVLAMLEHGLMRAANGTAFEPDHRSVVNSGVTV